MLENNNTVYRYPDLWIGVTHGGLSSIKGFSRSFRNNGCHMIIATYENNLYTILNRQELLKKIGWAELKNNYTSDEWVSFINDIKSNYFLDAPSVMLCVEANLGYPSGPVLSDQVPYLLEHISPDFLFAFTETASCIESMQQYLANHGTVVQQAAGASYQVINNRTICDVSGRQHLTAIIEKTLNIVGATPPVKPIILIEPAISSAVINEPAVVNKKNDENDTKTNTKKTNQQVKNCLGCLFSFFRSVSFYSKNAAIAPECDDSLKANSPG